MGRELGVGSECVHPNYLISYPAAHTRACTRRTHTRAGDAGRGGGFDKKGRKVGAGRNVCVSVFCVCERERER